MVNVDDQVVRQVTTLMKTVMKEEQLSRFGNLQSDEVERKKDNSVVTVADKASEIRLTQGLQEIIAANVVGEEAFESNPKIIDRLKEEKPCWIIDPLDGTTNFSCGINHFGMIVSLVQNDEVLAGWILLAKTGDMFHAVKGKGAFKNGKPLQRLGKPLQKEGVTSYANANYFRHYPWNEDFIHALNRKICHQVKGIGCSAYEYTEIAEGKVDYGFHAKLTPWDHMAGQLLVQEAGGYAGLIDQPYRPSMWHKPDTMVVVTYDQDRWNIIQEYHKDYTQGKHPKQLNSGKKLGL